MRPSRKEDYSTLNSPREKLLIQGFSIGKVSSVLGFVICPGSSNV